tara:strand:+ start:1475 stop:1909 length:435 start_codon:yes stop_codon:yes gene_type:complete
MILKMFKKKIDEKNNDQDLIKIISLFIHAAKIDEDYTEKEKKIIINFIKKFLTNKRDENSILKLIRESEEKEKNSNQILEYTKEVKKMDLNFKTAVIETLWEIILSDKRSVAYESNLMRRICGLLYVPDRLSGEIKSKILNKKD